MPILGLKIFCFFVSVVLSGWSLLSLARLKFAAAINVALAYGLGCFWVAMQIFIYLFIFHASFNFIWFSLVLLFEQIIFLLILWRRKIIVKPDLGKIWGLFKNINLKEGIVIFLIILQLVFALSNALARPTLTYDSLAAWSFKAKVLFYEKKVNFVKGDWLYLGGGGHINYPWLVPLTQFWFAEVIGDFNDLASNLIYWTFYLASLLLLYGLLRKYCERLWALAGTWMLGSAPLFFYHSSNGYADLPLAFFLLAAMGAFYIWLRGQDWRALVLAGALIGIAYFVKNEAIIFLIALSGVFVIQLFQKNIRFKQAGAFLLSFIIVSAPWLFFQLYYGLGLQNTESSGLGFHPEVISPILRNFFATGSWNIWWFIFFGALFGSLREIYRNRFLRELWLFQLLLIGGFILLYFFTEQYLFALDFTAIGRNTIVILPASVFVAVNTLYNLKSNDNP